MGPGEPCPAGLVFSMDLTAGTNCAQLPDRLRAELDAAEAARGEDADKQPLAPFPPQPESPPAAAAEGDGEGAQNAAAEDVEEEVGYGPGESALAPIYEDDGEHDVYIGMDVDPATTAHAHRGAAPSPAEL